MLIVHHVFRPDNTLQILEVGATIPWHACALGKATAAFVDDAALAHLMDGPLPVLTGRTIVAPDDLRPALEEIRSAGFAVEDEEAVLGEGEIAAPVLDHQGHSVGAIGVVGPVERLVPDGPPRADLIAAVKEVARGLSRDLAGGSRFARRR
jgi:DNA-binding IclR family transcriptional regulator